RDQRLVPLRDGMPPLRSRYYPAGGNPLSRQPTPMTDDSLLAARGRTRGYREIRPIRSNNATHSMKPIRPGGSNVPPLPAPSVPKVHRPSPSAPGRLADAPRICGGKAVRLLHRPILSHWYHLPCRANELTRVVVRDYQE